MTVLDAEEVVADSIAACRSARVVFNPHVGLRLHCRNGLGRLLLEDLAEFLLVFLLGELNDVAFDADKIRLGGLVCIDARKHLIRGLICPLHNRILLLLPVQFGLQNI